MDIRSNLIAAGLILVAISGVVLWSTSGMDVHRSQKQRPDRAMSKSKTPQLANRDFLKGSPKAVQRAYREALAERLKFHKTSKSVEIAVANGQLVRVMPDETLMLVGVTHPYALPATALFVKRIAVQYVSTCGKKLVVTSLTRPRSEQPLNASRFSVHPAGMAVDFRIPPDANCRNFLEQTFVSLERAKVIEATSERRPPHFHLVVFQAKYTEYVSKKTNQK